MRRKEFQISEQERYYLKMALQDELCSGRNAGVLKNMLNRGWLNESVQWEKGRGRYHTVYVITPAGRAVARQLGIDEVPAHYREGGGA